MDEIYIRNGKKFTRQQLEEKYGDRVDEAINKFGFSLQEEKLEPKREYEYEGKKYTREQLEVAYGDRVEEAIEKKGFKEVTPTQVVDTSMGAPEGQAEAVVKKKVGSEPTSPSPALASDGPTEAANGSSESERFEADWIKRKYGSSVDDLNRAKKEISDIISKIPDGGGYQGISKEDFQDDIIEIEKRLRTLNSKGSSESEENKGVSISEDLGNQFKSGAASTLAGIAGIKNFVNKAIASAYFAFDEDLEKKVNSYSPEVREILINNMFGGDAISQAGGRLSIDAQNDLSETSKKLQERTLKFEGNIIDDITSGNLDRAAYRTLQGAVGSSSSMALAMVPGGMAVIGAGAAAQKQEDLEAEGESIGVATALNSTINGVAEGVFERYTAKLGKGVFQSFRGKEEAAKQFSESIVKTILKDVGMEGGSEGLTGLTQQLSDVLVQGKDISPLEIIKNVVDQAIVGGAMGGTVSIPKAIKGYVASKSMKPETKEQIDKKTAEAIRIEEQAELPEVPDELRGILRDKATTIRQEVEGMTNKEVSRAENMAPEEVQGLFEVDNKILEVAEKTRKITESTHISDDVKEALIQDNLKEYEELKQQRDQFSKTEFEKLPADQKKQFIDQAKESLSERVKKEGPLQREEIESRAEELYFEAKNNPEEETQTEPANEVEETPETQTQPEPEAQTPEPVKEAAPEETVEDDFDYDALFNNPDARQTPEEIVDADREKAYQESSFDKKWAPDYKTAKSKLIDQYKAAQEEKQTWENKQYKSANGKSVEVGGELEGGNYSVDYINNRRRQKAINNAESDMQEAVSDLKELGLTDAEIEAEINPQPVQQSEAFTDTEQQENVNSEENVVETIDVTKPVSKSGRELTPLPKMKYSPRGRNSKKINKDLAAWLIENAKEEVKDTPYHLTLIKSVEQNFENDNMQRSDWDTLNELLFGTDEARFDYSNVKEGSGKKKPAKKKPTKKPEPKKEVKEVQVRKGTFTVETSEDGSVKIFKQDGTEVEEYVFRKGKNSPKGKKRVKNGQYSEILAKATGELTENQINIEQEKIWADVQRDFVPTTAEDLVMLAFAQGAKVSRESYKDLTKEKSTWASGFEKEENLPSIEGLAHNLWQSDGNKSVNAETSELRDAIETVLSENSSVDDIRGKIISTHREASDNANDEAKFQERNAYISGLNEEELSLFFAAEFDDSIDDMPEAEYNSLYNYEAAKQIQSLPEADQERIYRALEGNERQGIQSEEKRGGNNARASQSPEVREVDKQIEEATAKLRSAETALKNKAKILDKAIVEDQQDIFGNRKSQSEEKLFDERIDIKERQKATAQERQAVEDAQEELRKLRAKRRELIESGETTSEMKFEDEEVQAQGFFSRGANRDLSNSDGGPVRDLDHFRKKFKRFWNNTFNTNQGAPRQIAEVVRSLNRDISAFTDAIEYEASKLKDISKQINKKFKKDANAKLRAVNDYLNGVEGTDVSFLNDAQLQDMEVLRARIDGLSDQLVGKLEQQLARLEGLLEKSPNNVLVEDAYNRTQDLIETIKSNQGKYLNRAYEAFTNPDYLKNLLSDRPNAEGRRRIKAAAEYIVQEADDAGDVVTYEEARLQVLEYLDSLTGKEDFIAAASSQGNAKAPFLKKKKDIPQPIRELLGEAKDPVYNYVNTTFVISKYISNLDYQENLLNGLNEAGLASYEFKEGYTRLTPDSEGWRTLQGVYVPTELKESIDDLQPLTTIQDDFYRNWVKFSGMTKLGKTVLSPTTTARNIISGVFLGLNSGFFFMKNPKKTYEAFHYAWGTTKSQKDLRAERQKLIKLGILKDGAVSGEIMETLNDFSKTASRLVKKNALEKGMDFFQRAYALGDDTYKVIGFYEYKNRYMATGMTEAQAETAASNRITDTFPTYSKIPKNIQKLRRIPVLGTFVSFPYEVYRTTKNGLGYIAEDIKAGRKKMAMQQAAGMIISHAMASALSLYTLNMIGFDDDDDDALRDMLPEWQKNSALIYTGRENGKPTFIDGTALLPGESVMKPLRIIFEERPGRSIEEKLWIATKEITSPFLSRDISFKTMTDLWNNKDIYDREIYDGENLAEGVFKDPEKVAHYFMKQAGPGVYNNLAEFARANELNPEFFGDKNNMYGKEYTNTEALVGLFGFRFSTINYATGLTGIGYETKDEYNAIRGDISKKLKSTRKLSEDKLEELVSDYEAQNNEINESVLVSIKGSRKLGMSDKEIYQALKTGGFSREDISYLLKGKIPPLKPIGRSSVTRTTGILEMSYNEEEREEKVVGNYRDNVKKFNKMIFELRRQQRRMARK